MGRNHRESATFGRAAAEVGLAGKDVVLLPDADPEGEGYVTSVLALLSKLSPRPTARVVRLADVWRTEARIDEGCALAEWVAIGTPAEWTDADRRAALEAAADAAAVVDLDAATVKPPKSKAKAKTSRSRHLGGGSEEADPEDGGKSSQSSVLF